DNTRLLEDSPRAQGPWICLGAAGTIPSGLNRCLRFGDAPTGGSLRHGASLHYVGEVNRWWERGPRLPHRPPLRQVVPEPLSGTLPAGHLERTQPLPNRPCVDSQPSRDSGGEHCVLDVVLRFASQGDGDLSRPKEGDLLLPLVEDEETAIEARLQGHGPASLPNVPPHALVAEVSGHPDRFAGAVVRHGRHSLVIGIEHTEVLRHLDHDPQIQRELVQTPGSFSSQRSKVQYGSDVAPPPAQP